MTNIAKLEINLRAIKNRIIETKSILGKYTKICAVVKANAYGFGMEKISKAIRNMVDYFAVARVYEAIKLRNSGIYGKILILSPILEEKQIILAIKYNIEITISSVHELEKVNRIAETYGEIAKVHLKVDTGMNRFGVKNMYEFKEMLELLNKFYNISIVGLYSHFAVSSNESIVNNQIQEFEKYINFCHKRGFYPIVHISSSKQSRNLKCAYDMVRIGIDLYEIDEEICFSGEILEIKDLKKGESLGYDYTFTAKEGIRVACIDIGYADIAVRKLSNNGKVLINGRKCNIIGNVCMDCMFADITDISAQIGDHAVLFGVSNSERIRMSEVANNCGTISYELFVSMSERVKRIYK